MGFEAERDVQLHFFPTSSYFNLHERRGLGAFMVY